MKKCDFSPHCQRTKLSMSHGSHGLCHELFNNPITFISHMSPHHWSHGSIPLASGWEKHGWCQTRWYLLLLDSNSAGVDHQLIPFQKGVKWCYGSWSTTLLSFFRKDYLLSFFQSCFIKKRMLSFHWLTSHDSKRSKSLCSIVSLLKALIFKN